MNTITIKNLYRAAMDKTCGYHFYVGRGSVGKDASPVGNPFIMQDNSEKERTRVCKEYEAWFIQKVFVEKDKAICGYMNTMYKALKKHGKLVLFCYCYPKKCHAETIMKFLLNPQNPNSTPKKEEPAPTVKANKVKTAKFKVYKKDTYTGYYDKDVILQEVVLTHVFKTEWHKPNGEKLNLKSSAIKNHLIVENKNGVAYYFVKGV
jgi:hypothetical protein